MSGNITAASVTFFNQTFLRKKIQSLPYGLAADMITAAKLLFRWQLINFIFYIFFNQIPKRSGKPFVFYSHKKISFLKKIIFS